MKSFITGGTGFIGMRLIELLLRQGDTVHCFGLPGESIPAYDPERVRMFHGDICDRNAVQQAMRECDRVFHLAGYARNWARSSDTFYRVNVLGTENVLACAAALGIKRVMHTSSNVVFGPSNGVPVDEESPRHSDFLTAYERSKEASERVVRAYVRRGLHVVIVNPTRVFGPGPLNEANSVTKMITQYLDGTWRTIPGNGRAIGNYVFVDDLVRGMVCAIERGAAGENYLLGGDNLSYDDFFKGVAEVTGCHRFMIHLPATLAIAFGTMLKFLAAIFGVWPLITPEWVRTFLANWENVCTKARRDLGYTMTPFKVAVRQTLEFMVHSGQLKNVPIVSFSIPELGGVS